MYGGKLTTITSDDIHSFLNGNDKEEKIIKVEYEYSTDYVSVIHYNAENKKMVRKDPFYPFLWCTQIGAKKLYKGDREKMKSKMVEYHIWCKGLYTYFEGQQEHERMKNGYSIMFYAQSPMSYDKFLRFFQEGGEPLYRKNKTIETNKKNSVSDKNENYVCVAPNEQYLIMTGKRLFKGFENYDDLVRMEWDLETDGLEPEKDFINQIGVKTNKGYEHIFSVDGNGEERWNNELIAIDQFFKQIKILIPDVITGHNTENFDWNFIDVRLKKHGSSLSEYTKNIFKNPIYKKKKESVLKLGGEIEYYYPTVMTGTNITDSLIAVRRAQAIDSNMKKADLKYATKYAKLVKPNRVYVKGKMINKVWKDINGKYAFNDNNGDWYKITDEKPQKDGYEIKNGRYIVERYLLDDIWEGLKVEERYNETNFSITKIIPINYEKACTTGTATLWKYIMLAWSYEHNLAIPALTPSKKFTGGLSRLIKTGYISEQVKLDYNSLYPSIILSWDIKSDVDIMNAMNLMLNYVLTEREKSKDLKKHYGDLAEKIKEELEKIISKQEEYRIKSKELIKTKSQQSKYDKDQSQKKTLANSFFGAYGSGDSSNFYWSDVNSAEQTTCTGRQLLRLMISHFTNLGYDPIVGDTDGFDFALAKNLRYTKDKPYVSIGKGRNYPKGTTYDGVVGDIAEFEDLYLNNDYYSGVNKCGLGLDDWIPSSCQIARKNYCEYLEDKTVKIVGNTMKSKKMPIYIEKFIDKAIPMLLKQQGKSFIELYYDYIEKIYNYKIPIKDIATIGKIKISLDEYKEKCEEKTISGQKRSRQAWYELAIRDNLSVNMGDSIYYVNTGLKKGDSDVKRNTTYYLFENNEKIDKTKIFTKEFAKIHNQDLQNKGNKEYIIKYKNLEEYVKSVYPKAIIEDEISFNCVRLPSSIIDDDDHFCYEEGIDIEYNSSKYIDMFNKRIKPLLVCFDKSIRTRIDENGKEINNILIDNPKKRKLFTEEQCKLVNAQPFHVDDEDSYEQLMTMEDKEINFWMRNNTTPPYAKEIGMDWEQMKKDYIERQDALLQDENIKEEKASYDKIIDGITAIDVEEYNINGVIPEKILKICDYNSEKKCFVSKKYKIKLGNIYDIVDKTFEVNDEE